MDLDWGDIDVSGFFFSLSEDEIDGNAWKNPSEIEIYCINGRT